MGVQIAVKNIEYDFSDKNDEKVGIAKALAETSVREWYQEEQEFQNEEYEAMLEDGNISSFEEYKEEIGIGIGGTDYSKSFEENKDRPEVMQKFREYTQKYMCNAYELPKNVVIDIDGNFDKDSLPKRETVLSALSKEYGIGIKDYGYVNIAKKEDILSQEAYNKIGEMIDSKDFQTYLDLRASIGKYSSNNISMIYLQKHDAQAVMGFHAWKDYDRYVGNGQNGIAIWMPTIRELKTEKQVDKYIADRSDYYGEPTSRSAVEAKEKMMKEIEKNGKVEKHYGFRTGYVFDVSQTTPYDPERDTLSQILNLEKPLDADLSNYDKVVESMQNAAVLGKLKIYDGVSQQDALFDALERYADTVLKDTPEKINGIKGNKSLKGDMHRIESIMTAYLICSHIGIDSGDKAGLKLAKIFDSKDNAENLIKYGKREMFTEPFDRACRLSDMFIKEFDKDFGYSIEEQRNAVKQAVKEKQEAFRAEKKNKSPKVKKSKTNIDRD